MIGRTKECGLTLPHESVSRSHAVVRILGRDVVIENRSSFGTLVNGQKITSWHKLRAGDKLNVGPYVITVLDRPGGGDGLDGTQPLNVAAGHILRKKLAEANARLRHLEKAAAQKLQQMEDQVKETARELESEVWRGFATNRDLADAKREVKKLQDQLEEIEPGSEEARR